MSLFQEPFFWLLAPLFVFVAVFKLIERFDSLRAVTLGDA